MGSHRIRIAAAAALVIAPQAAQAQPVSYAYDGEYIGGASVIRELSGPACAGLPFARIDIRDGALRAWDGGRQVVKGLVTHDGFFNADYYGQNGIAHVFEGTIDRNGAFIGGVTAGPCAYVVTLYRSR